MGGISSRESSNSSESPTSSITSGSTRSTKTKENDSKMNNNVRKDNHFKEYNNHNNRAQTTAEDNGNWNVFKKTSTGSVPKQYSKDATSKRNTNTNREPSKLSSARNDK